MTEVTIQNADVTPEVTKVEVPEVTPIEVLKVRVDVPEVTQVEVPDVKAVVTSEINTVTGKLLRLSHHWTIGW